MPKMGARGSGMGRAGYSGVVDEAFRILAVSTDFGASQCIRSVRQSVSNARRDVCLSVCLSVKSRLVAAIRKREKSKNKTKREKPPIQLGTSAVVSVNRG